MIRNGKTKERNIQYIKITNELLQEKYYQGIIGDDCFYETITVDGVDFDLEWGENYVSISRNNINHETAWAENDEYIIFDPLNSFSDYYRVLTTKEFNQLYA